MKYHIHIPKLLEFTLNVVCDDVTLHGKNCLITPIPYPLYLRCIVTYADKYDKNRHSTYRFYREVRSNFDICSRIGRLYPNVLGHVVLDDDDVNPHILATVAECPLIDDAVASIHRFASRCLAADKSESMENAMSQVLAHHVHPRPIVHVLIFYGAKFDHDDGDYFTLACAQGLHDVIQQCIDENHVIESRHLFLAIESGNCDSAKLVFDAYIENSYRESLQSLLPLYHLLNATVESMELLMSLNIIQRGERYSITGIPSFSVLQWIEEHDVMEHDAIVYDVSESAVARGGHYFDMLKYLIEQQDFAVPHDVLACCGLEDATDLDVLDYLICHGADVNAIGSFGNVLECSPMLIRYWIDKGLSIKSTATDGSALVQCVRHNMTVPVLEMMIDKYSMDVNAYSRHGDNALYWACYLDNCEVVKMLLNHGAVVESRSFAQAGDRARQLLLLNGYKP